MPEPAHSPEAADPGPAPDAAGVDSGGLPWAGRRIEAAQYADDAGSADPAVLALARQLAGAAAPDRAALEERLVAALATGRVLVPLLAQPDAAGTENRASMATALLQGPDGTQALPVFTGVATLAAWDPAGRPVPTATTEAARSALEEGCVAMLLDIAEEHAVVLRTSQLWALAMGEVWLPAHADPVVRLAVAEAAQGIDGLVGVRAEDGALHAPGTLRLVLSLRPGLPPTVVEGIVGRLGERLAAAPDVRRRIDDLAVVLHQATEPADTVPPDPAP